MPCCGKVFCEACIRAVLRENNVCPHCKTSRPDLYEDKRLKQTLRGRRVVCQENSGQSACDWVGELGQLDSHLNLDPPPEKQLEGCQFAMIKCKFCPLLFQRRKLNDHQHKYCSMRPDKCRHCGHRDTHERVVGVHLPVCHKYPKPCPNCGKKYERQKLDHHVNEKCPLILVPCDYHVVGCEVKPARQDMQDHIKKEVMTHVSLLQQHLKLHPQQSSDCLLLVTSCLERVMVNHREIHERQDHNITLNLKQIIQERARVEQVTVNCQKMCEKQEKEFKAKLNNTEFQFKGNVHTVELRFQHYIYVLRKELKQHREYIVCKLDKFLQNMTQRIQTVEQDADSKCQALKNDQLNTLHEHIRTEERNHRHMEERLRDGIEAAERRHKEEMEKMEARLKKNMDDLQSRGKKNMKNLQCRGVTVVFILGIVFIAMFIALHRQIQQQLSC